MKMLRKTAKMLEIVQKNIFDFFGPRWTVSISWHHLKSFSKKKSHESMKIVHFSVLFTRSKFEELEKDNFQDLFLWVFIFMGNDRVIMILTGVLPYLSTLAPPPRIQIHLPVRKNFFSVWAKTLFNFDFFIFFDFEKTYTYAETMKHKFAYRKRA